MSLWLREQGIEHDRVFLDTGWEHPATYEYLRGPLARVLGPIVEVRPPRTMEELIRHKGMFPSRVRRFCTDELKLKPFATYLRGRQDQGDDVLVAVGVRAEESAARSQLSEWEWQDGLDCEVWRPLLAWTEADVIEIHRRHGLPPNSLYLQGARRVGCWPCVMSRKDEIRLVADLDPQRIDRIRELESEMTAQLKERCAAKGEAQRWPELTFFQGASASQRKETWPIDKAVAWSRTSRGGKESVHLEVSAERQAGCMRWGLCEATGASP